MSKLLVETTGSFMLLDPIGQEIPFNRAAVVESSNFINLQVALDKIRILGKLKDEAADAEFVAYWRECDGDGPMAVESFLSKFSVDAVAEKSKPKAEEPKRRTGRKPKLETSEE